MQFPSDKIPVEKWYVFKGKLPPNQKYNHYIVIVYKRESCIRYFYVTSKVEKAHTILMMKDDLGALVELDTSDWEILTKDSCIQCDLDHLVECYESDIRQGYEDGTFTYHGKVPENIRIKIIQAICASVSFEDEEKTTYSVDE